MPRSNLGVLLAGCAAVAVGVVGGWTALALKSTRAPLIELTETISTQDPSADVDSGYARRRKRKDCSSPEIMSGVNGTMARPSTAAARACGLRRIRVVALFASSE